MRTLRLLTWSLLLTLLSTSGFASTQTLELVKHRSEQLAKDTLNPVLDRFCGDQCKALSYEAEVEIRMPEDTVEPGFEEYVQAREMDVVTAYVTMNVLVNQELGVETRKRVMDVLKKHAVGLPFALRINETEAEFPQPASSARKLNELKEQVVREVKGIANEVFRQFCPEQCVLSDIQVKSESVSPEEALHANNAYILTSGDTALKVNSILIKTLLDTTLTPEESGNILKILELRTVAYKASVEGEKLAFPHPIPLDADGNQILTRSLASLRKKQAESEKSRLEEKSSKLDAQSRIENNTQTQTQETKNLSSNQQTKNETQENINKQERFERFEKIERVENGDAVQKELQVFKVYGLIFGCSILGLLLLLAFASMRPRNPNRPSTIHRIVQSLTSDPTGDGIAPKPTSKSDERATPSGRAEIAARRYEIDRLMEELSKLFAEQPRVAKHVFTRILREDGIEVTAQYIELFGEGIVLDLAKDPNLQSELAELAEFYAKTQIELNDEEKLELLKALYNRAVGGKMVVLANRTSGSFEFLAEMDSRQILELIRNESLTVKAVVMTQIDPQKRTAVFSSLDPDMRLRLLEELSRIDHLPKDYIYNAATALRRKRTENPRLNTEALPGSEVLVGLLERAPYEAQRSVIKQMELNNPDSARAVKQRLVSIDTLRFLKDSALLDVVLSLKHDELLQFLAGTPKAIRETVFSKSPKELVRELEEELGHVGTPNREVYHAIERKVINRIKLNTQEGAINLIEVNERMFGDAQAAAAAAANPFNVPEETKSGLRKVVGW